MAFVRVIVVAALVLATPVWPSHPIESARDQYEARENLPQHAAGLYGGGGGGATVRPHIPHRFEVVGKKDHHHHQTIPELQVGCADGTIHDNPDETKKMRVVRRRRRHSKAKRSYYPWAAPKPESPLYPSLAVWRPPMYALSRPYYIPVYGAPGRVPIYYPPQRILINPGVPANSRYQGPTYLPPGHKPTTTSDAPPIDPAIIENRFNSNKTAPVMPTYSENGEDQPIWDAVPVAPPSSGGGGGGVVPTRRPSPARSQPQPPLVHNVVVGGKSTTTNNNNNNKEVAPEELRPNFGAPPQSGAQAPSAAAGGPSNCVWAIISCCSTAGEIRYECFEQRGCPGAFWDRNPCNNEFAQSAIENVMKYYNSK